MRDPFSRLDASCEERSPCFVTKIAVLLTPSARRFSNARGVGVKAAANSREFAVHSYGMVPAVSAAKACFNGNGIRCNRLPERRKVVADP